MGNAKRNWAMGRLVAPVVLLPAFLLPAHTSEIPQIKKTIRAIAIEEKIKPEHLLAMAWVESRFNPSAIGDNGKSAGAFQIQFNLHGVDKKACHNVEFAARWACRYLKQRGYTKNQREGIRRYNGGGPKGSRGRIMSEAYADKVLKAARRFK